MRVKGQISLLFQRFCGDVFCNKSCTVHYIINVISKAGADVVRTITSCPRRVLAQRPKPEEALIGPPA